MKKKWLATASAVVLCMAAMTTGSIPVSAAEPYPDGDYPGDYDLLYPGDMDADGRLTVLDVVIVQQYLHGNHTNTSCLMNADFTHDGIVDIFDLALMKRELIRSYTTYTTAVYTSADELYQIQLSITTDYYKQSDVTATWIDPDGDREKTDFFTVRNGDVLTSEGQWEQDTTFTDGENYWIQWGDTSVTISCQDSEGSLQEMELSYPDRTRTPQSYTKKIENPAAPEITSVEISAETYGNITQKAEISKSGNWLADNTAGKVGTALDIDVADSITQYQVTLHYNKDELRWVPEENLIVLEYDPNAPIQLFVAIPDIVLDTEHSTITFNGNRDCCYILADAYQWYKAKGQYPPEYQYTVTDITQYTSDWERAGETGDIMTLADKEWAKNHIKDGVFTVSTAEELASAVYYINAFQDIRDFQPIDSSMDLEDMADLERIDIVLENDIDLAGYDWVPITVYNGELNGNGHVIRNVALSPASSMGFILHAQGADIHDITFENVSVTVNSASGTAGLVAAQQELPYRPAFENVHVSGTISIPNGGKYGGILGTGEGTFTNCTANVSVNGTTCTYLSSKERETQSQIDDGEELVTLTLDLDAKMLTRTTDDNISDYGLVIIRNGEKILERGFKNSETLDMTVIEQYTLEKGSYQMYVNSYRNGSYQRISNIVSYDID